MKIVQHTFYVCDKCGTEYGTKTECLSCEKKPVELARVKIGDKVKVLSGDGTGEIGKVEGISTLSKDWGHYMAKRYHHTQILNVKLPNGFSRSLTFDAYEKAK